VWRNNEYGITVKGNNDGGWNSGCGGGKMETQLSGGENDQG
jgi:hypothetical protein